MAYAFNDDRSKVQVYSKTEMDQKTAVLESELDEILREQDLDPNKDQELVNIRTGYDSMTYLTAGDAVRTQVSFSENAVKELMENILEQGSINSSTGETSSSQFYVRTKNFIEINDSLVFHKPAGIGAVLYYYNDSSFLEYATPIGRDSDGWSIITHPTANKIKIRFDTSSSPTEPFSPADAINAGVYIKIAIKSLDLRNSIDALKTETENNIDVVENDIDAVEKEIEEFTLPSSLSNPRKWVQNSYINTDGNEFSSEEYFHTEKFAVQPNMMILFGPEPWVTSARFIVAYDQYGNIVGAVENSTYFKVVDSVAFLIVSAGINLIDTFFVASNTQIQDGLASRYKLYVDKDKILDYQKEVETTFVTKTPSKNLINPRGTVNGFISNPQGGITPGSYITTDYIYVPVGESITVSPRLRKFIAYDVNKVAISNTYISNTISEPYTFTASQDCYIKASLFAGDSSQIEFGATATNYEPFVYKVEDGLLMQSNNVLSGKKWVACGDSFTHGDFTGISDPTEYTFQDPPYQGENMVYPFFIGRRNSMDIVNEAINGSHMGYVEGRGNKNFSAPNGRYTQIPEDADYITLYFGINDGHQNVPIGTINDNVNTTFYGAWNIVMTYLVTHYPNAKIGIIISNGCNSIDYPNAEIAIAKKYGVSYFDMNGDPKIPLVFRVNGKPDLSQEIKNIRNQQYYVGNGNAHPNVKCHEDESTFIEAWLRTL